jgi:thiol-disulfide isomerase/thioredoxin/Flp pilus assembly protein TadD
MRTARPSFQLLTFAAMVIGVALLTPRAWAQEDDSTAPAKPAATGAAYESDPQFIKALAEATAPDLSNEEKLARWKKANQIAGDQCVRCLQGMISAEFPLRLWKEALATAVHLDSIAVEPRDKFGAEASAGKALMHGDGGPPTMAQMAEADKYLRLALTHARSTSVIFLDGQVLAALGRNDEARDAFRRYVRLAKPGDSRLDKASQYRDNPQLATADGPTVAAAGGGDGVDRAPTIVTQAAATSNGLAIDAGPAKPEPAYMSDPKFQKALAQAKEGRQTVEDRLENWKHANKVAGGQCIECLHQMIVLQARLGAVKDEVKTAESLEAAAADTPKERYFAESMRGSALMAFNYGQPKPDQVTQAEIAFRDVLAHVPKERDVLYLDGRALAMQGKFDEAKTMFDRYVDLAPASDKMRVRAERFSEDPHLATLAMAPPFRLVTSDGQEMQLDDMNGKVVLIDFWATWCGPCMDTLPEVQKIAHDYANDPLLVIISVSTDADAGLWRTFIQKHNMTWPQYRDANNSLRNAYGVTSIPRFFTIDTNGALKSEQVGSGADVRSVAADLVKKAHKAEAQKAKVSDGGWVAVALSSPGEGCIAAQLPIASNSKTGLQSRCSE